MEVNGFEPEYSPMIWNNNKDIKMYNNCYAYVLDDIKQRKAKPQPGRYTGDYTQMKYTCKDTYTRMIRDNPLIYKVGENQKCRSGYYKGFLAMDPGEDYHYYRQDRTGYWSHKPGNKEATDRDADGEKIINPRKSNRNFRKYYYKESCGYFCIPGDKTYSM